MCVCLCVCEVFACVYLRCLRSEAPQNCTFSIATRGSCGHALQLSRVLCVRIHQKQSKRKQEKRSPDSEAAFESSSASRSCSNKQDVCTVHHLLPTCPSLGSLSNPSLSLPYTKNSHESCARGGRAWLAIRAIPGLPGPYPGTRQTRLRV